MFAAASRAALHKLLRAKRSCTGSSQEKCLETRINRLFSSLSLDGIRLARASVHVHAPDSTVDKKTALERNKNLHSKWVQNTIGSVSIGLEHQI